ncbi:MULTISPECIES: DUF167 domain-containing protein [Hydrocarboniphaga]|jgi:uncharacterized protein (TIGR00251 family)|uniref:UPF0235 protein WQQ_16460 n=1 Tax=Hydrocarboniphaga effusa AP103 TaxID=1172194 RepID=I7ZHY2_9GAMM|nr:MULTISPECIES: DUF167 domain-containing protein [Hydrocarboniphaga]EIT71509.1 hypothetical protein WQQ_16460 [Hydrocarboniphaga effusa AP103]MDZ4079262.1 DUF167 domain-containing protein [Hydrocarboniphaga sp.]
MSATRLRLRVSPKASSNRLVGWHGEALKLRVTAAPERGKANDAVIGLLAEALDVPRQSITLVHGETAQDKIVEIAALDDGEIKRRITAWL